MHEGKFQDQPTVSAFGIISEIMTSEYRVLVHPITTTNVENLQPIWRQWIDNGCKVLTGGSNVEENERELEDTSYINELAPDTTIVLGGQRLDWCIAIHFENILDTIAASKSHVNVVIDGNASCGGKTLSLSDIAREHGVELVIRK